MTRCTRTRKDTAMLTRTKLNGRSARRQRKRGASMMIEEVKRVERGMRVGSVRSKEVLLAAPTGGVDELGMSAAIIILERPDAVMGHVVVVVKPMLVPTAEEGVPIQKKEILGRGSVMRNERAFIVT